MEVVEIRIGLPVNTQELLTFRSNWPDLVNPSSYVKHCVPFVQATQQGLDHNAPGYPSHIDDSANRAVLVYDLNSYRTLAKKFPQVSTFSAGGFGENFVVDHVDLSPSIVCIGDVYRIGNAEFTVTGPRFPCPKVDAWHNTTGLQKYSLATGTAGYFMKVTSEGQVHVGDRITLLQRKNPGYTIERISKGLWGSSDEVNKSTQFYRALGEMEDLLGKGYRNVAIARLKECEESKSSTSIGDDWTFYLSRFAVTVTICAILSCSLNTIARA